MARHGHVQFRTKYGVQMGGYDDASYIARVVSIPPPHVPHVVHAHVLQSDAAQHVRDARTARPFRPRWRRDRGQRGLAAERGFIGALDERARRPHAFVLENDVDHDGKV